MIEFGDVYYLGLTSLVTVIIQISFFLVAYFFQIDKVTDFAGATNFIVLALLTFFGSDSYDSRMIAITVCAILWGIRIAGFLLYRILKTEKDDRFDEIRGDFIKFLGFWIFQMFWVWVVSLPVTLTNSPGFNNAVDIGTSSDIAGIVIFSIGLIIETVADIQKFQFNSKRTDRLSIMNTGLWHYSRHPNYFGEILAWWGVFIASTNGITGDGGSLIWLGILSPIMTMGLLLFLSGIPQSEPKKDKSVHDKGDARTEEVYFDYIHSTSPVILLPPTIYRKLPSIIKLIFFFEFPFYRFNPNQTPLVS